MVLMVLLSSLLGDARDAMSLTSNDLDAGMALALHFWPLAIIQVGRSVRNTSTLARALQA